METNKLLEKLTKHQNHKKRIARNQRIRQLKEQGFKQVASYPDIFINESGNVYNVDTDKELKADRLNTVLIESGKRASVPKLLLLVFRDEPIKENNRIRYIDGNRSNLSLSNVEYNTSENIQTALKTK